MRVCSFPPLAHPTAHTLILGSMPGVLSLRAQQYYAHPRNAFWPIMAELYGFSRDLPYAQRAEHLMAAGIAVWDVLHSCVRPGSLDSAIARESRVPNDLPSFLRQHPQITLVGFNGGEAESSFKRYIWPNLQTNTIRFVRLPSTSPAHAALSTAQKIAAWRSALISDISKAPTNESE